MCFVYFVYDYLCDKQQYFFNLAHGEAGDLP
jgi:hypothetical protein